MLKQWAIILMLIQRTIQIHQKDNSIIFKFSKLKKILFINQVNNNLKILYLIKLKLDNKMFRKYIILFQINQNQLQVLIKENIKFNKLIIILKRSIINHNKIQIRENHYQIIQKQLTFLH